MTRYYALEPAEMGVHGLFRVIETEDAIAMEYLDPHTKKWVDDPKLIDYLDGESEDAREVWQAEASKIAANFGGAI